MSSPFDVKVVEIGEQSQIRRTCSRCTRSITRMASAAVVSGYRGAPLTFDQHRRADAVGRACGVREILGADVVLGRGRVFVDAMP